MSKQTIENLITEYSKENEKLEASKKILVGLKFNADLYQQRSMIGLSNEVELALSKHLNNALVLIEEGLSQIRLEQEDYKKQLAKNISAICAD